MKISKEREQESKAYLLKLFKDKKFKSDEERKKYYRVYVNIVSVSRSGMSRRMQCYVCRNGNLERITWHVNNVLAWGLNDNGISVGGCGMDMAFHLVYTLSATLFPKVENDTKHLEGGYKLNYERIY